VGSRDHLEIKVIRETLVIKGPLELLAHPQVHPVDQDLAGHRGLVDQGGHLLWMKRPTSPKDLPMTRHLLLHPK